MVDKYLGKWLCIYCAKKYNTKKTCEEHEKKCEVLSNLLNEIRDLNPFNIFFDEDKDIIYHHNWIEEFGNKGEIKISEVEKLLKKNNNDIQKTLNEIEEKLEEECEIAEELNNIKKRERGHYIQEKAEKLYFGKVKTKRTPLSKNEQESILNKFNNECAICGADEGLHIHHKDHNPKNNQISNLIVLCGVCHKKIHMKVR
jgi:5-methylcytosine-specific restriction endonuclease McrA